MSPTGDLPNRAAGAICISLRRHESGVQTGRAYSDNAGFKVNLQHRESLSPDAAFHTGEPAGVRFLEGAPVFAVGVRSAGDYGPKAGEGLAREIADYFATGTPVVRDVDLLGEDIVEVYRASEPTSPIVYRRGETAEAEPAVPAWAMPVDTLFD